MRRKEMSLGGVGAGASRLTGAACALAVAVALGLGAPSAAVAETFRLAQPGDSVIGSPFYVKTRQKDTLLDFARQNNMGYDDLNKANPKVDMWLPGDGTEALIPSFWVLPNAPRSGIVLNRAEKRLYYYPPDDPDRIDTFAISIGKDGWDTPLGSYSILEKKKDPTWTPPASIRAAHAADGDILPDVVPAGPDNPLGQYAMRLSNPSYLIHGTNKPWGLGMQVSSGCIRMYPEGIAELLGRSRRAPR
jgi:L,D-transpeptidase ErfK/SrfK